MKTCWPDVWLNETPYVSLAAIIDMLLAPTPSYVLNAEWYYGATVLLCHALNMNKLSVSECQHFVLNLDRIWNPNSNNYINTTFRSNVPTTTSIPKHHGGASE